VIGSGHHGVQRPGWPSPDRGLKLRALVNFVGAAGTRDYRRPDMASTPGRTAGKLPGAGAGGVQQWCRSTRHARTIPVLIPVIEGIG